MDDAQRLADRYVAVWNEADPDRRRHAIAELWTQDGQHYVDVREARGYEALEMRIIGSYDRNIRDGGHRFRAVKGARALRDVVTFDWEMLHADSERIEASGSIVLIADGEGRILVDYQFIDDRAQASA